MLLFPGIIHALLQHLSVILDDGHKLISVCRLRLDNSGTDIVQHPVGLICLIADVDLISVDIRNTGKGIERAPVIIDITDIGDLADIRIRQPD